LEKRGFWSRRSPVRTPSRGLQPAPLRGATGELPDDNAAIPQVDRLLRPERKSPQALNQPDMNRK